MLCSHHLYVEGECTLVYCAFKDRYGWERTLFLFSSYPFLGYYAGSIYYHMRLNRLLTYNNSKLQYYGFNLRIRVSSVTTIDCEHYANMTKRRKKIRALFRIVCFK